MANKNLVYFGIGIFVILLIGNIVLSSGILNKNIGDAINDNIISSKSDLSKYRSEDIPEDCRLPDYQNNVESWKEHLSHHQETLYCLDYYE